MLNILNDIISISKIESQQIEVSVSDTNINEQVKYIYHFFKLEAEQKKLHISFKNALPAEKAFIKTDREKVYAVLTNLVKNAIKFTQTGSIEIGYKVKGKFLEFFVKDSGPGIPDTQKKIIFERFRQGSESLTRNYEGAGLGLSISKAYVEMLGGKIWVENNTGLPSGSAFFFTIPFQPVKETTHDKPDNFAKDQIRKLKVLIVEDDETSEKLIIKMVEEFAGKILKAIIGVEAIQVYRKIREFNREVVIIAQTAHALAGDREKSIAAGCNDYISKPVNRVELKKK
jgi:hypothetical protein